MIEKITSPQDIKSMSLKEMRVLCGEIRDKITEVVSEGGGHLASNLGMVETTVAIHRVFDTPRDVLIFDVGHQCYAHKMLTGRYGVIDTLRKTDGISGFTNAEESEYDVFTEGHSGTSLSQALGVSAAMALAGDDRYVIAVIGDGSFTNGMIYEALNNCRTIGRHLIIILNDNEMSISKNVGGLSGHLTRIRTSRKYFTAKHRIKSFFSKVPLVGKHLISGARRLRDFIKKVFLSYNLFEALGADYIGVANGNDLGKMMNVLLEAKTKDVCTVVHIHTKKGKGYAPAEEDPEAFHSVAPFNINDGTPKKAKGETFSSVFGRTLCDLARENEDVCAVTAAMEDGTGLSCFDKEFPDRFFDVGIAEEHAVTFAAGLAKGGLRPVVALYSTFSQRTFDQVFHDFAIQSLPAVVCIDRAGIVEGDGVTHQGIFDVPLFSSIPGINIYSPDSFAELRETVEKSVAADSIDVVRYPKGAEPEYDRAAFDEEENYAVAKAGSGDASICAVTYGRVTAAVFKAAKDISEKTGCAVKIIRLKRVFPIDGKVFEKELYGVKSVLFVEEGIRSGGAGEKFAAAVSELGIGAAVRIRAIDGFVPNGSLPDLLDRYGFTPEKLSAELKELSVREACHE